MFAQIATLFLAVASLEAAWGSQLLLEPDLEAIWNRFGRGLGRQDAAMFAQIATVFFRVASLEAAWGWQLLLEPDLEAIWRRFKRVLNQFWLPK